MKRIYELIEGIRHEHPGDDFFNNFERDLESWEQKRTYYKSYDNALRTLDEISWQLLKLKAINHFCGINRPEQLKEDFFNHLNEALAYAFLVRRGYSNVRLLPDSDKSRKIQPDIAYQESGRLRYCEVKTIGISDDEIKRRHSGKFNDRSIYKKLDAGFLNKLDHDLRIAHNQISSQGGDGLIYVVIRFDGVTLTHYRNYRKQLVKFLHEHPAPEIFLRMETCGNRRIYKQGGIRSPQ